MFEFQKHKEERLFFLCKPDDLRRDWQVDCVTHRSLKAKTKTLPAAKIAESGRSKDSSTMTQDQSGGASGKRQRDTAEPTSPLPPTAAQRTARARSQIVLVYAVIKNSPQRPYVHESKRSEQSGCLSADNRNMYIVSTATLRRARPQRWSKARCVVPSLSSPR